MSVWTPSTSAKQVNHNSSLFHLNDVSDEFGNAEWVEQYPESGSIGLLAWDAGTDAGATYTANNEPLTMFEPIRIYDAEDASNIFFNQDLNALLPLCEVTITLIES